MSKLGDVKTLGRLGNSMFQYSFLRTKANELGVQYSCPHWWGDDIFELNETNRIISEKPEDKTFNILTVNSGFTLATNEITDGTEILGYFQSPKYFDRKQVLKWFTFKLEIQKSQNDYNLDNRIAVHVRRGDYLSFKHVFNILGKDYYLKALSEMATKRIALFSDNMMLAKSLFFGKHVCIMPIHSRKPETDLFLMTKCNGVVMANSSFSFWGAYLNKNQNRIVCPKKWYSRPRQPTSKEDIVREEWKLI